MSNSTQTVTALSANESEREIAERLIGRFDSLRAEQRQTAERQRQIVAELRDVVAACRVFGIHVPSSFVPYPKLTVRSFVTEKLLSAGPDGLRVRDIRPDMAARNLHPKTIGMTLYRLQEEGKCFREGHRWFAHITLAD